MRVTLTIAGCAADAYCHAGSGNAELIPPSEPETFPGPGCASYHTVASARLPTFGSYDALRSEPLYHPIGDPLAVTETPPTLTVATESVAAVAGQVGP